jgi:phosphatidylinositol alpha-1,6-mannosyltransferase
VLATHEFFPILGGVAIYVHELAKAAVRLGYEVRVLAPHHSSWDRNDLGVELDAISPVPLHHPLWIYPETVRYLIANRAALRHQTIHLCQQNPLRVMMVLGLLGLVRPRRLIITLHGSELLQLRSSPLGGRWLLRKLLEKADRIAVLSRWVQRELTQTYPSIVNKVVVAPGAPRSEWSRPIRKLGKSNSRLTVLTVARILSRKGQHTLLEALGRLDKDLQHRIRYVIVGPVINRRYAKVLAALADKTAAEVVFTGPAYGTSLRNYYAEADIFALTSAFQPKSVESFGIVYLEASASGLPVLGLRTGGVEDAVADGVTGLLVDPGDQKGLDSALMRLLEDSELRERLGSNGIEWARRFSWDRCAETIYGNLC